MAKKIKNEKSILQIDEHNLEKEWVDQPDLYYRYANELAGARLAVDECKAELELTKAELDSLMRTHPDRYKIQKVSETAIASAILQQSSYQQALANYNSAVHSQRMLDAMTSALEQRKDALSNLVKLQLAGYYAEPVIPARFREAAEETAKIVVRSRGRRRMEEESDD